MHEEPQPPDSTETSETVSQSCENCAREIVYPSWQRGDAILCPHCNQPVVLGPDPPAAYAHREHARPTWWQGRSARDKEALGLLVLMVGGLLVLLLYGFISSAIEDRQIAAASGRTEEAARQERLASRHAEAVARDARQLETVQREAQPQQPLPTESPKPQRLTILSRPRPAEYQVVINGVQSIVVVRDLPAELERSLTVKNGLIEDVTSLRVELANQPNDAQIAAAIEQGANQFNAVPSLRLNTTDRREARRRAIEERNMQRVELMETLQGATLLLDAWQPIVIQAVYSKNVVGGKPVWVYQP